MGRLSSGVCVGSSGVNNKDMGNGKRYECEEKHKKYYRSNND